MAPKRNPIQSYEAIKMQGMYGMPVGIVQARTKTEAVKAMRRQFGPGVYDARIAPSEGEKAERAKNAANVRAAIEKQGIQTVVATLDGQGIQATDE